MSQATKWRLAPLAAVAATVLTIGAGTGPVHARDDMPVEAAAMTLPRPRPSSPRSVPAPLDVRVTAAPVDAEIYQQIGRAHV